VHAKRAAEAAPKEGENGMQRSIDTRWLLRSLGLLAMLATPGRVSAKPVPVDEPGSGSGGSSGGNVDPTQCNFDDIEACADMGGLVDQRPQACWCEIYEWVPRRVINASDGDAGIVPIDGRGSEIVTAVTEAIGQLHRHAVMFYGDGEYTRHDTMYVEDIEDGSLSDAMEDYVPVLTPVVGSVRFDEDALENGLPGAISQTIDDTYDRGRLARTGLILKPALVLDLSAGPVRQVEADRPQFEAAVTAARSTNGYYKLSDYTDQDSMGRPWSSSRVGDLRGSHCSGYVIDFYRDQGLTVSDVTYPADLRAEVGELLFEQVRDECRSETGMWKDVLATVTGHWSVCSNIAHQVANCFADQGCDNLSDDWRDNVSSGSAVSPDNMLPDSFRYEGALAYNWSGTVLEREETSGNGYTAYTGQTVDHPGLDGDSPTTSATSTSPFKRVEALVYSGGYLVVVDSVRL
jgi:hypothetical protein